MTIRLADTHAHLDLPEILSDQEEVLARAGEAGVALIVNVGIGLENSRQVLATARKHPGIRATINATAEYEANARGGKIPW